MDKKAYALQKHYEWKGKLEMCSRVKVDGAEALSIAYTPGVAEPCLEIQKDINKSFELTRRWNTVAVITDGTAVLGLGDIGPEAGMPVMEGKCVLFKEFAGVDAIPLCLKTKDVDELVRTIYLLSGSFGGINLEDISAPRCFEVEEKLKALCDIPVFHDDQHGTAIIVTAAAKNAARVVGKAFSSLNAVVLGAGAAGCAIAKQLISSGIGSVTMVDKTGILREGDASLSPAHAAMAKITNPAGKTGGIAEALAGADLFVGVAAPGIVSKEMISSMADHAIVFSMSNPIPEIMPEEAKAAGAAVVGTGRSDYPNQINNVLAFPGIFRGALDCRAAQISEGMKKSAADAIASLVSDEELTADYILPKAFDPRVGPAVAAAVAKAAREEVLARQ